MDRETLLQSRRNAKDYIRKKYDEKIVDRIEGQESAKAWLTTAGVLAVPVAILAAGAAVVAMDVAKK